MHVLGFSLKELLDTSVVMVERGDGPSGGNRSLLERAEGKMSWALVTKVRQDNHGGRSTGSHRMN